MQYFIDLGRGYKTEVDQEDFDRLNRFRWHAFVQKHDSGREQIYAGRISCKAKTKKTIMMHAAILKTRKMVDHRDGDGLNNRRSNLRAVTNRQNQANARKHLHARRTSEYKGVYRYGDKWHATISDRPNHQKYLGSFREESDAAQAYNLAAELYYGEFARLNTPNMPQEARHA